MNGLILFGFLIGFTAGLRALTPLAFTSWAAKLGVLHVGGTPLAFMGYTYTPWIFTILALGELVNDKLPKTPSRKVPPQFIARILTGALSGATLGASADSLWVGLLAGAVGAVAGTLGGAYARGKLAAAFGKDLPAALLEDVVALLLAFFVVKAF